MTKQTQPDFWEKYFRTDYSLDLYVHPGAGAYICGEETALLESLEGKRGNPRLKPPFPAVAGLYACPTVVNNVETIASVVPIVNMAGENIQKWVLEKTGTKLISASGHINKPGVYEIELGFLLKNLFTQMNTVEEFGREES